MSILPATGLLSGGRQAVPSRKPIILRRSAEVLVSRLKNANTLAFFRRQKNGEAKPPLFIFFCQRPDLLAQGFALASGAAISVGCFDAKKHRPQFKSGTEAKQLASSPANCLLDGYV